MHLQVIDLIHSFGGDVIKFAGDAVIVVFHPRLHDEKVSHNSIESGSTLILISAEFTTSDAKVTTIHIGVPWLVITATIPKNNDGLGEQFR